ncbi:MAG: hypothetical protein ACYDA0_13730 [Candidatus Dormibacteraceae bacterium]
MNYPPAKADVFYELARDRFDRQLNAVDAMDAKLATFLAIGGGLVALLAAIYAIRPGSFLWTGAAVLALATVVYAALVIATLSAMRPRQWNDGPCMEDVYQDHITYSEREIMWRAARSLIAFHKMNADAYAPKARIASCSPFLLLLELALVVVGAVLVAVSPGPAI